MKRLFLVAVALCGSSAALSAQSRPFVYPAPPESAYRVVRDVPYGGSGADALRMDVYRPAANGPSPTLVFFNLASGADRAQPFYVAWAQVAAAQGITAVLPDLRRESFVADAVALVQYLSRPGAEAHGIDRTALAVYAGSGNVSLALPFVQDPRSTMIKAAVMYYGVAEVASFRADLPVLFVRAGLDRPPVNRAIDDLVAAGVRQNAPVSLINHASGRHAFEMVNDDDATRRILDRTLAFVKEATSPPFQAALRQGLPEAVAAGHVTAGRTADAAAAYAALVAARPDDPSLRLAYGEALLGNRQFAEACAELDKLKGKGLGYRDLGVPAARACMQKGDAAAAIAWLESIPLRFRPMTLRDDPIFAPIRERPEFLALFPAR